MSKYEEKNQYKNINLSSELREDVINKINNLYDDITKILKEYSKEGRTDVLIFISINENSKSIKNFYVKLDNQYKYFKDKMLFKILKSKLRKDGIKSTKYYATD